MFRFLLFSIFLIGNSFSSETYRVGYIEFPPVFSTTTSGKAQGILIDLLDQVGKELDIKFKYRSTSTKRMTYELVNGNYDIWLGLKTLPDFEGKTHKGDLSVYSLELRAYSKRPIPNHFKKVSDVKNQKIVMIKHFSYGGHAQKIKDNNPGAIEIHDHERGLKLVERGRIKYLLDYKSPIESIMRKKDYRNLKYKTLEKFDVYFVISKKTKNGKELLNKLEGAYLKLKKQGKLPSYFH